MLFNINLAVPPVEDDALWALGGADGRASVVVVDALEHLG